MARSRAVATGVLLDATGRPHRGGLTILVPQGHEDVYVVGRCHVCGAEFGEGQEQAWQKHVGACARKHMDEILASRPSERNKGTLWDPNMWDPELDEHMRQVGLAMAREGRMEVRRNERAGFS